MENRTTIDRIILFNDTSTIEHNPGCYITVAELKKNLLKNYPGSVIETFPLGYGYEYFKDCDSINRIVRIFKLSRLVKEIKWRQAAERLFNEKLKSIKRDFLIVINAEGTIHHNALGGFTLLGIAYILSKKGYNVKIVNGSFFALDKKLLYKALRKVAKVVVRENYSYTYLKSIGVPNLYQGADCAFLATPNIINKENRKKCLFSPGVLYAHPQFGKSITNDFILKLLAELKSEGYFVSFLQIEEKEYSLFQSMSFDSFISISDYSGYDIFQIISDYDLVVSGRYHILIFAGLLNKEIIPIPSNTWKIEGSLRLMGINEKSIINMDSPDISLTGMRPDSDKIAQARKLSAMNF